MTEFDDDNVGYTTKTGKINLVKHAWDSVRTPGRFFAERNIYGRYLASSSVGSSGDPKSTPSNLIEKRLKRSGIFTAVIAAVAIILNLVILIF